MNSTRAVASITSQNEDVDNFLDIFSDLEPIDLFDVKKDQIAANLAALVACQRKNRSQLAQELGWTKSRISNVLSGKNNLTLKTIWDLASHMGFDYDVIFREPNAACAKQPWQHSSSMLPSVTLASSVPHTNVVIKVQTPYEVQNDIFHETNSSLYFSFHLPPHKEDSVISSSVTSFLEAKPIDLEAPVLAPLTIQYAHY